MKKYTALVRRVAAGDATLSDADLLEMHSNQHLAGLKDDQHFRDITFLQNLATAKTEHDAFQKATDAAVRADQAIEDFKRENAGLMSQLESLVAAAGDAKATAERLKPGAQNYIGLRATRPDLAN